MSTTGKNVFSGCTGLESVTIPDSIEAIEISAFYGCTSLKTIEIPDSVTALGNSAFSGCTSLETVEIPDSVTTLGSSVFSGCTGLTSVVIPDSIGAIPASAFARCSALERVVLPDSVTSIGNYAFQQCTSLAEVEIPDSVTSIGDYAFQKCTSLTEMVLPDSVTTIGKYAFNLSGLERLSIPKSVTTIGDAAFAGCSSLQETYYEGTSDDWSAIASDSTIIYGTIYYGMVYRDGCVTGTAGNLTFTYAPETLTLTISGSGAMADYTTAAPAPWSKLKNITTVIIEDGVTSVGNYAFYNQKTIASVTIGSDVTKIGNYAFNGCVALTDVSMSEGVTSFGSYAFSGCTALESIVIPDSVTSLGTYCFNGCTALKDLTLGSGLTTIGTYAFHKCESLVSVVIPDSVTSLGSYAFHSCTSLKEMVLSAGLKAINQYMFYGCSALRNVTIPSSVTSIGTFCFYNSYNLNNVYYGGTEEDWDNVTIGANNTYLSYARIHYLGNITASGTCGGSLTWELSTDGTLTIVGQGAMEDYASFADAPWSAYADQINSVIIGREVASIGANAFSGCTGLTDVYYCGSEESWENVTVSAGNEPLTNADTQYDWVDIAMTGTWGDNITWTVTTDGTLIYSGEGSMKGYSYSQVATGTYALNVPYRGMMNSIRHAIVEEGITSLGSNAFTSLGKLESVSLPSSLKTLGDNCFRYCNNLKEVTIPDSVTAIPSYCFYNCSALERVNLPEGLTSIGERAFDGCISLTEIDLPDTVKTLGNYAFGGCTGLTWLRLPESLTGINNNAFQYCSALERIYIPAGVTAVGADIFYRCTALSHVFYAGTQEQWETFAIDAGTAQIHCGVSITDGCGQQVIYCPECDENFTLDGSILTDHVWNEGIVTTEPTCTQSGEKTFTCGTCGRTETESMDPLGHTELTLTGVEATCTVDGLTEGVNCSACGEALVEQEVIPALGHSEVIDEAAEPTCTETGLTQGAHCDRCGEILTAQEVVPANGHSYNAVVTAPTCTEQGYTTRTCGTCGDTYTDSYEAALGHEETILEATAPTCTETGLTAGSYCAACGTILTEQETVSALGHEVTEWTTTKDATCAQPGEKTGKCIRCDHTETAGIDRLSHSWGAWTETVAPTVDASGEEKRTCASCGGEETRTVEKKSNPFTDVVEGQYYYDPVLWAVKNGITTGLNATTFGVDANCTRGQFVTFLWRAAGSPAPTSDVNPFADVEAGQFYSEAVLWAVEKGITTGLSATRFGVNEPCTRAQVVTFLWRFVGSPAPTAASHPFTDAADNQFYSTAILWAVENGITTGLTPTLFGVNNPCNRAQVVTFLYRTMT